MPDLARVAESPAQRLTLADHAKAEACSEIQEGIVLQPLGGPAHAFGHCGRRGVLVKQHGQAQYLFGPARNLAGIPPRQNGGARRTQPLHPEGAGDHEARPQNAWHAGFGDGAVRKGCHHRQDSIG